MRCFFARGIFLNALFAFAATAWAQSPEDQSEAETAATSHSTDKSSRAIRENITGSVGVELFLGLNVSASYQLSPNHALEAWYEEEDYWSLFAYCIPDRDDSWQAGLRLRTHVGNSFNVSFFPYYHRQTSDCLGRRIPVSNDVAGASDSEFRGNRNEIDAHGLGLGVSIGNRWQWRHFYLGGEWFGAGIETAITNHGNINPKKIKLVLARFVIGYSF